MQEQAVSFVNSKIGACKKAFIFVGIFSFFVNILMLTVPIYMLQIFDRVLASQSFETLFYLSMIAIVALFVFALLDMSRSHILVQVSHWLDNNLSPEALIRSPDEILQGRQYGSQSLRDIASIRQFLCGTAIFAFFDSPWMPVYLLVIFLLHPLLGSIALAGAVVLFAFALLNEYATRGALAKANGQALEAQKFTDTAMRNAEAIQAMGMMPALVKLWYSKNEEVLTLQSLASKRSAVILSLSKFLRLSLQLGILGTGAYLVVKTQITPGTMIAASILMSRALAPIEQAIGAWRQMVSSRQAYKRIKQHFEQDTKRTAGIQLPTPTGVLSIENAFFAQRPGQKPILQNICFEAKPGEMIAIIGPAAAGKSSLARLMVGAWKSTAGSVRLDGADVYTWDRDDFGKHVGYLPQDVELFDGTIKENVARMGEIDSEAIIQACIDADVHHMILRLPEGYDTELRTGVFDLSGGQRQRLALARALYKSPKLIVLDEPNSNLDSDGEVALLKALNRARANGSTIILIAHRPSIVKHVDKIMVLNDGRVQFSGPRDEVMAQLQQIANLGAIDASQQQ